MDYKVKTEATVKISMTGNELLKVINALDKISFVDSALINFYDVLTDASYEVNP